MPQRAARRHRGPARRPLSCRGQPGWQYGAGVRPALFSAAMDQAGWQRGHQKMSRSSGAEPWLARRTGVPQRRHGRPARP